MAAKAASGGGGLVVVGFEAGSLAFLYEFDGNSFSVAVGLVAIGIAAVGIFVVSLLTSILDIFIKPASLFGKNYQKGGLFCLNIW